MFKLSWKIFLLGGLLMLGTRAAHTATVAPIRQPNWSINLEVNDAIANQTQLLLTERGSAGKASFLHAIEAKPSLNSHK